MNKKSLIQATCAFVFPFFLAITTATIYPRVSSAENTSNTALDALEEGIEFNEQGDLAKAESLYQEAIENGLANHQVEIFIAAKQRLGKIKESQGNMEEANKLYEESIAAIKTLETATNNNKLNNKVKSVPCGQCWVGNTMGEYSGSGSLKYCDPCKPGV